MLCTKHLFLLKHKTLSLYNYISIIYMSQSGKVTSEDAHDRRKNQHQPHHHPGEVHREDSVQNDEDVLVCQPFNRKKYL